MNTTVYLKHLLAWVEKRDRNHLVVSHRVSCDLQLLSPSTWKEDREQYYLQKLKFSLMVVGGSLLLTVALFLQSVADGELHEGNRISRGNYGEKEKTVEVIAKSSEGENAVDLEIEVGERKYTSEEVKTLYQEALSRLEETWLGDNESPDHVDHDLVFPGSLSGYPFRITWECENYRLIDSDGTLVSQNIPETGKVTQVSAKFDYDVFSAEVNFPLMVFPAVLTPEEQLRQDIEAAVAAVEDGPGRYETELILPEQVGDHILSWKEKKDRFYLVFPLLGVITAVALFYIKDQDLHKELLKREKQIRRDYPDMVSKLSVYMGAGMTIRGAMEKLVNEYEKQKEIRGETKFLYEEMKTAMTEMQSGISESAAYERFGRRCASQLMLKFSNLVVQNLRKGSTGLTTLLRMEAENALRERKNEVKKQGEEISVRLLLPMMMQLCVVMIMIMIPAFLTFGN